MAVEEPPVSIINNARIDNQYRQNCNSILWRGGLYFLAVEEKFWRGWLTLAVEGIHVSDTVVGLKTHVLLIVWWVTIDWRGRLKV